jgi:cell division protein FtsB
MSEERTQAATPNRNPITTGEYVPDATPEAGSTRPTGPHRPGAAADLPDIPGYAVTHELARGGMGRVLAATDLGFGREVAVKVLLPGFDSGEAAGRFVREARITGRLTHPGIPPAHHLGTLADGSPFLAMKLVRGRTLAALLADRPTPAHDLPRFVGVFEQVCQAVGFAHARIVVHRDLKPANVMVGEFGEVQVMDWGLAFEADDDRRTTDAFGTVGDTSLTAAGAVMGTPAYMAPEQARGEPVGAAADVFALGGILCEVLTGTRPFRGSSGAEVVAKAAAGELSDALDRIDACGADAELIDVARRCLSPAVADRPADGTAVAGLVAAYRAGVEERLRTAERERAAAEARAAEEANTRREAEAKVVEQRRRKRVQLWLAAAAVLLVAGVGAAAVWRVQDMADKKAEAQRQENDEQTRRALAEAAGVALLDDARVWLENGNADRAEPFITAAGKRFEDAGVKSSAERVAAYQAALSHLRLLDGVNTYRWTPLGPSLPKVELVAKQWAGVFRHIGIVPGTTPPVEAAAKISGSPIRESLLAALHVWLVMEPTDQLRAILEASDRNPFRSEVRQLIITLDWAGLLAVTERPEWDNQPVWLVVATSPALDTSDERRLLERVARRRPTDFSLMMKLGATYPIDVPDGATERVGWYQAAVALKPESAVAVTLQPPERAVSGIGGIVPVAA